MYSLSLREYAILNVSTHIQLEVRVMIKLFCKVLLFILLLPVKLLCMLVKLAFRSIVGDKSEFGGKKKCCGGSVALGAFVLVLIAAVIAYAISCIRKNFGCGCDCDDDCDCDCDCDCDDDCDCDCDCDCHCK